MKRFALIALGVVAIVAVKLVLRDSEEESDDAYRSKPETQQD